MGHTLLPTDATDLAPFMRVVARIWAWAENYSGDDSVSCPFCQEEARDPIGLVHDQRCPAAFAARWLQEHNR